MIGICLKSAANQEELVAFEPQSELVILIVHSYVHRKRQTSVGPESTNTYNRETNSFKDSKNTPEKNLSTPLPT